MEFLFTIFDFLKIELCIFLLSPFILHLYLFYIYLEYKHFIRYRFCKCFLLLCGLSFHILEGISWRVNIFYLIFKNILYFLHFTE